MSKKPAPSDQPNLFDSPSDSLPPSKFVTNYRVALVRDRSLPFEQCRLTNSQQAQPIIRKLIEAHGQSDREQFCVILLNVKNEIVGLNIVATGTISSAQVSPREVLKPAIWANSAAMILCHIPYSTNFSLHRGCIMMDMTNRIGIIWQFIFGDEIRIRGEAITISRGRFDERVHSGR